MIASAKKSPFEHSNSVRSYRGRRLSICQSRRFMGTYLPFASIYYHSHPLHVDTIVYDPSKATLESFVKCVEVLRWNGAQVDYQGDVRCPDFFSKVNIRTVEWHEMNASLSGMSCNTYQRGDSISMYSLFRGAVAEEVKYCPRIFSAFLVRKSFGGGPRFAMISSPMPTRSI